MKYNKYLKSNDWKNKRSTKWNSSKKRCGICAATTNLDTHHLSYKDLYSVTTSDLRLLCRRCHFLAHDLMKAGKIRFTSPSHHSRFAILKVAVKKELGLTGVNMFK